LEYLVTMTTHVPDGTSDGAIQDIRDREAARSSQLATQRRLLRLWRPPLQPGEWRTLGLFAADTGVELEGVLASMPLRVWRTDEVTPLSPHPDDPAGQTPTPGVPAPRGSEFLTTFTLAVPADAAATTVEATPLEAERARELARQGFLKRLWSLLPGPGRAMGLWEAPDSSGIGAIVASLPMHDSMRVRITLLTAHPSDPALTSDRRRERS
jgi:muconolactone delta-isomerase